MYISIHTLHTEGDSKMYLAGTAVTISIHTLHTEGDLGKALGRRKVCISIHTLHTEGDGYSQPFRKGG